MGQPIVRCNHCGILTPLQPDVPYRCLVCGTAAGQAFGPDAGWLYRFMYCRMQYEFTFIEAAIHVELRERGYPVRPKPGPPSIEFDQLLETYYHDVFITPLPAEE